MPLVQELRPAPDPWEVVCRLAHLPHLLFLDSALRDSPQGRYSFVTADPFLWMQSRGTSNCELRIADCGFKDNPQFGDPFTILAEQLARWQTDTLPGLPPFQGGAAGLWGYDLCHHLERLPRPRHDEFEVPDLALGFYDWVLAFDHHQQRAWLFSTGFPASEATRTARARTRQEQVLAALQRSEVGGQRGDCGSHEGTPIAPLGIASPFAPRKNVLSRSERRRSSDLLASDLWPLYSLPGYPGVFSNFDHPGYLAAVQRAIDYVHAGDCFQVNLAQRLLYRAPRLPLDLYQRLRTRNPAPFAGYLDLGKFSLLSASPERFVRVQGKDVETRPIKGTRPRGSTDLKDQQNQADLLASPKDRAENVMIVDLLRNDLGRVCAYGSIAVKALCRLESYRTVHHLVSEVHGRLRPECGPIDLLRASFPGGSVTGAPKIRAMEIIAELEPSARGPYCGCLGYIGFDGNMDTNILIRTLTLGRGWVQFPVGGGIVADSTPEQEYAETLAKAAGLLRALSSEDDKVTR